MQNAETTLNPSDLQKYTAHEVASLVDVDSYAVRDEGQRRQDAADKKISKLKKQMEAAIKELADSHLILNAFFNYQK